MEGMEKQTAVNWLVDKLEIFATEEEMNIIKQAKEMEKAQIMESYMKAKLEHIDTLGLNAVKNKIINDTEQYYNETFKSE